MASDVSEFKSFYGKLWADVFGGRDPIYDQSRANAEVMHRLEQQYLKWDEMGNGGYGRLFMFKLMAPEADKNVFTWFRSGDQAKILPAFRSESLSFLKLGLKFFNQTDLLGEPLKNTLFDYISNWHNASFRAFYGQRSNRNDFMTSYLSDLTNERLNVLRGSPLLDDITPYQFAGGMQQQLINPQVARSFGLEPNESIGSVLGNGMLFPSAIRTLSESTLLSYTPKAYINAGVSGKSHPAIHGYRDYANAIDGNASALIGDAMYRNLVYEKSVNHFKGAYNEVPSLEGTGRESINNVIDAKGGCY